MKSLLSKLQKAKHGQVGSVVAIVAGGIFVIIGSIVIVSLLPTYTGFVAATPNITASDSSLLALIPTFLIIGLLLAAVGVLGFKFATRGK